MKSFFFITLLLSIFLFSQVSSIDINQLNNVKTGKFIIQSQDGIDQFYDVQFNNKLLSNDIEIKYCLNEVKLQEVKDGKVTLEKPITKSEYDKYTVPSEILVKVDDTEKYEQVSKEFVFFGKDCITITANPYEIEFIKLGFNSTYIVPEYQYTLDAQKSNTTSVPTNVTYLEVDKSKQPYDNLIYYYAFDSDLVNSTAYDWSGYGNNGTYLNGLDVNESRSPYGASTQGDGTNDYISFPNEFGDCYNCHARYFDNRSFSISAWFYHNNDRGGVGIVQPFGTGQGFAIEIVFSSIGFFIDNSSNNYDATVGSLSSNFSKWTHVVGVFNKDTNRLLLYLDSGLRANSSVPAGYTNISAVSTAGTINRVQSNYYNNSFDEIMIFNDSLTTEEVMSIFLNQSDRFYSKGSFNIVNQSYMNITSGDNKVNVSTSMNRLLNTNISLSVNYYNGSWVSTPEQNISSTGINIFEINTSSTNLTLNYSFYSLNQTNAFYTPLLIGKINFTTYNDETLRTNLTQTGRLDYYTNGNQGWETLKYVDLPFMVNPNNTFILYSYKWNLGTGVSINIASAVVKIVNTTNILVQRTTNITNPLNDFEVQWTTITDDRITKQNGSFATTTGDRVIFINLTSPINVSNSFISYSDRGTSGANVGYPYRFWGAKIVNSTQLMFYVNRSNSGTLSEISWEVISWKGANVQSGSGHSNNTGKNYSINAVNLSNTLLMFNIAGNSSLAGNTSVQGILGTDYVQFKQSSETPFEVSENPTIEYYVISHPSFVVEQNISEAITTNTTSHNLSINLNTSRSFLVHSSIPRDGGIIEASARWNGVLYLGNITNSTQVMFQSNGSSLTALYGGNISFFAVNIQDDITGGTPPVDSCTYSGSGNWNILWTDNCVFTTNQNALNNLIYVTGNGGTITFVGANITGVRNISLLGSGSRIIYSYNGGFFKF